MRKLLFRSRSGEGYPMVIAVTLCLLMLFMLISEYFRVNIIVQGVRDAVQQAVIATVNENYDDVYHSVREGYAAGWFPEGDGEWFESIDAGDIYGNLSYILGLTTDGEGYMKYAGNELEYKVTAKCTCLLNARLFCAVAPPNGGNNADQSLGTLHRPISLISDFLKTPPISKNQKEIKIMSEKVYVLNVYNTMTGQYELIQVTKEVFQTYRRTKWNIEDSTERFFKHETQMSSLIGGENEGYERFHEFIDYENTPENQAIEEMVFQSLRNVLDLLPPKDYELVYELYFKNCTERECAQRLGMSQQAVHERKKRILKKIKNNLDEEGC